jgi:hypothetical protein
MEHDGFSLQCFCDDYTTDEGGCGVALLLFLMYFDANIKRPPQTRREKSLPPGGRWPRRGRKRNAGKKPKVSTMQQTYSQVVASEQVFTFPVIQHCRPHSSSVMKIAFGDFHDS